VDGGSAGSAGSNAANSFSPSAILGMVQTPSPSVVIMWSSSAVGQGDTASTPERDLGYLARMLSTNTGYCRMVRASQTAVHFLTDNRRRLSLLAAINPTHVIYQLGTNDITNGGSFETVQARLVESYGILAGMGFRVVATTFTPVVTTTDSYATVENQTPNSNNDIRIAINNWLRTVPAPLSGLLEIADVVESARDSGRWKANGTASKYTADGQHLSQFAHELVAAALAPQLVQFSL
jgi:lysophospholipase L1-like esterase